MDLILTKTPKGALRVSFHPSDRAELVEMADEKSAFDILLEGTESYWTNGSYRPFDAGDANPSVGLTDAPCIAESMDYDDDGQASIVGDFWFFNQYAVECFIERMLEYGYVDFTRGPRDDEA